MNNQSRVENLLATLLSGETTNVVPQSRIEKILLDIVNGETDDTFTPQSRIEAYLKAISENGLGGSGGGASVLDSLIDRSITEVSSNVEYIGESVFMKCSELTTINLPKATIIATSAFRECSALHTVNIPEAKTIGASAIYGSRKILTLELPKVETLEGYALQQNNVTALILRGGSIPTMVSATALSNSAISKKTGYIYVPKALLSDTDSAKDYRLATNWSTYATQFRALEDYTVDGTITGELDESKI